MGKKKRTFQGQPPKNDYQTMRKTRERVLLDIGMDSGSQRIIDYLQCALHDPVAMGGKKNVFGPTKIRRILEAIDQRDKYYANAYNMKKPDADKLQEELDLELRDIWGDETQSFAERQPYIKQAEYTRAMKGWVD
jgi:hypothetical protein